MHAQAVTRADVQTAVERQCAVADGNEPVFDRRWPDETDTVITERNVYRRLIRDILNLKD